MKKTIFTFCSVIAVCALVFLACSKDDTAGSKKVSYSNQTTYGTGNNPNPNNNPSSTTGGVTTSTTGTVATTYGTINNGTSYTFTGSSACGSTIMQGTCSAGTVILSFPAAPAAGAYSTVQSGATGSQVVMVVFGATATSGGTVTVTTSGGKFTATFTTVTVGTTTITGSLTCM